MERIKIKFPDGSIKEVDKGVTAFDIAKGISERFSEQVLVAEVNGKPVDLATPINDDCEILFYKFDSDKGKETFWHTSSHLMAQAIEELYDDVKFGVGPAIENGFYYDVDCDVKFTDEDLKKIEDKMLEIAARNLKPVREEMPREKAIEYFRTVKNDPYKVEILETIAKNEPTVSLYHQGGFTDLCRGPHLPDTSKIKAVKLLSVSGSYWRGDEKNKMLQRIYGVSFPSKKELDKYLNDLEEAKKRDHRKIGRELELYMFHEVSPGAPFWLPNGMILYKELEKYSRELHHKYGYDEINTPIVVKDNLFRTSGHLDNYSENMFKIEHETDNLYLKPMNCPESTLVYSFKLRSYKDLPLRLFEIGRLHRNELSGALGGMFRVRQITMDDAHIFCANEQVQDEITGVLALMNELYKTFGFEPSFFLSTRPDKAMGSVELWNDAEAALANALTANGLEYKINPKDGAFYGPKIDVNIKDALGRKWQLATIQLDYLMPENFDLTFEGNDGKKHRPVMIHRAIYGSFERFTGIITEHFAGNFPVWLCPVQVAVMNITEGQIDYSRQVNDALLKSGIRSYADTRNEKIGYKIREAENKKIPYMIILGDNEMKENKISVRQHLKGDIGKMELKEFTEKVNLLINQKSYIYDL
jgi:threonyl-tRNA synthetase